MTPGMEREEKRRWKGTVFSLLGAGVWLFVGGGCGFAGGETREREARMEQGLHLLEVYDFNGADSVLSLLAEEVAPTDANGETILYGAAVAAWHKTPGTEEGIAAARGHLEALLEEVDDPDRKARYALDLGRIAEVSDYAGDAVELERAKELYERARGWARRDSLLVEAELRLAQLALQRLDERGIAEARGRLQELSREVQEEPWRSLVLMYLGQVAGGYAGEPEAALEAFLQVDPEYYPMGSQKDGFLWRRALLSEESGRVGEAIEQLELLLANHPRSVYRTVARRKVAELEGRE